MKSIVKIDGMVIAVEASEIEVIPAPGVRMTTVWPTNDPAPVVSYAPKPKKPRRAETKRRKRRKDLTPEEARQAYLDYKGLPNGTGSRKLGGGVRKLAKKYGVTVSTIYRIGNGTHRYSPARGKPARKFTTVRAGHGIVGN